MTHTFDPFRRPEPRGSGPLLVLATLSGLCAIGMAVLGILVLVTT